jgi:hypothetical protein
LIDAQCGYCGKAVAMPRIGPVMEFERVDGPTGVDIGVHLVPLSAKRAHETRIAGDDAAHPTTLGKIERAEAEESLAFMDEFLERVRSATRSSAAARRTPGTARARRAGAAQTLAGSCTASSTNGHAPETSRGSCGHPQRTRVRLAPRPVPKLHGRRGAR